MLNAWEEHLKGSYKVPTKQYLSLMKKNKLYLSGLADLHNSRRIKISKIVASCLRCKKDRRNQKVVLIIKDENLGHKLQSKAKKFWIWTSRSMIWLWDLTLKPPSSNTARRKCWSGSRETKSYKRKSRRQSWELAKFKRESKMMLPTLTRIRYSICRLKTGI